MGKFIDLTGAKFERLKVVQRIGTQSRQALWQCICDCGKEAHIRSQNLTTGRQKSCGCLNRELTSVRSTIHGYLKNGIIPNEYKIWSTMIQRCTNPKDKQYVNYGGRGIRVCESWMKFECFIFDMGMRPSPKHTIDRLDFNGNYDPSNCSWETWSQQAINKRIRSTNKSGHKGISWSKERKKWCVQITNNYKTVGIGRYDNIDEAIEARKNAEIQYRGKSS